MQYKIPFNRFSAVGLEEAHVKKVLHGEVFGKEEGYTQLCERYLEDRLGYGVRALLTTSCTHALEMSALLLGLKGGDEFIVPSYTFVSSALALMMRGAQPVFADIRPDTLNIDERKIESLITVRTKAIVVVHYAGIACEMNTIMSLARKYNISVIEDNAHGLFGKYNERPLGTIGHLATQSFHETKNISCGEGGAIIINDSRLLERAHVIRDKGTNRRDFLKGNIDKYSWIDFGSSYTLADLLSGVLYGQLTMSEVIQRKRKKIWDIYFEELKGWIADQGIEMQHIPANCTSSYHMFALLMPDSNVRNNFINHMRSSSIQVATHYLPLHNSKMGMIYHNQNVTLGISESIASKIVRLPIYYSLKEEECRQVSKCAKMFKIH